MQNTANAENIGITALAAVNIAKVITIGCLVGFAVVFGIQDWRQVIYMSIRFS